MASKKSGGVSSRTKQIAQDRVTKSMERGADMERKLGMYRTPDGGREGDNTRMLGQWPFRPEGGRRKGRRSGKRPRG